MTDAALSMDPDVMDAQAATVRAPAKPYVSEQLGASDVAPMMIAAIVANAFPFAWVGPMPIEIVDWIGLSCERARAWTKGPKVSPLWPAERARAVKTAAGPMPEILAVKAGLRERAPRDAAMRGGVELEPLLVRTWWETRRDASLRTMYYALDGVPEHWREERDGRPLFVAPKVTHKTAPLVTYPDGWGDDAWGDLFVLNAKCTVKPKEQLDPPYWIQAQAEMAVTGASSAVLPHGIGWLADWMREPVEERPIKVFTVQRDEAAVQAIEAFAVRAVEWIRETAKAAGTL